MNTTTVLIVIAGLVALVAGIVIFSFGATWLRAQFSGAKVTFGEMISLQIRGIPIRRIVDSRIKVVKSDIPVTIDNLSTHYLAGGQVEQVCAALINAKKANIDLVFDQACAIDLATKGTSKNVVEAVHTSVNPQVIDVPPAGGSKRSIDAVAKDGIVIKARARVTVRTNLTSFVGGATEDTIIARVGEG
ncbi:MAG: flotillin-like FloA family protein, partial [Verrucomicrobiota bacterium]|nr:flotillin-like FloA family protein [Verrucomicrobiota bacterium]